MSSCSAAEIAEKKRIALEKLNAKKAQLTNGNKPTTTTMSNSTQLNTKPATNFYKSPTNVTKSTNLQSENKASSFLNALKHISGAATRQLPRDVTHPYRRVEKAHKPLLGLSPQKPLAPVFVKTVTCRVYMISATRFAVHSSGYHEKLIQIFKQIPSKSYDNNTRIWNFSLKDYELLQKSVAELKPDVVMGIIPKSVIKLCQMPQRQLDYACLATIEPTLANKLLPFQQEGVCFAIAQHGCIMICDEMGLGKTYQALAIADYYRENWPLLICTTASTRESWANHIRELLPMVPMHYIQVLISNQQYIGDAKVLITSYNMMERHFTTLTERKFNFLIFDESHMLKNSKAKCTTVADRLAMQAKHIILLSGTPALSRPVELFTQLQLVDRKFMSYIEFTSRYCDAKQTNFGWDVNGQSNLEELNVVLKLKYMLRRTKADVLPQMAEKFRETVILDPALIWTNDEEKTTLDSLNKSLNDSKGKEREEILLRFYARTAEVKTRAVCAYLKTLLKEQKKFIVFAHHRVLLDAICECLFKQKVVFVRIDGQTRNDLRAEYIKTFQSKLSCKVAVLSLKACNSGITLTAAELIVFAELDWNPSILAQAESRAHRIGQNKPVICRYLMAHKTADDTIWNMLKNKQDVLNKAGIFCENLQDATHSVVPVSLNKIDNYFSPVKIENTSEACTDSSGVIAKQSHSTIDTIDIQRDLQNIDAFFNDDDDNEVFKDLLF